MSGGLRGAAYGRLSSQWPLRVATSFCKEAYPKPVKENKNGRCREDATGRKEPTHKKGRSRSKSPAGGKEATRRESQPVDPYAAGGEKATHRQSGSPGKTTARHQETAVG